MTPTEELEKPNKLHGINCTVCGIEAETGSVSPNALYILGPKHPLVLAGAAISGHMCLPDRTRLNFAQLIKLGKVSQ